jgi:hypothetical protein
MNGKLYLCCGWKLGVKSVHVKDFWVCEDASDPNEGYGETRTGFVKQNIGAGARPTSLR